MRSLILLLLCLPALAAGPIRLPEAQATPQPTPGPTPVTMLKADQWFVIDSDIPVIVITSREGYVSKTMDAGPIKLKGKFADGKGAVETRTYKGPHVYTLEAVQSGTVELIVIPVGMKSESEIVRRTLQVEIVESKPDPKPNPKPEPTPYVGKWRIVVIEETADAASNRGAFFADESLQAYVKSHCSHRPRVVDQNVTDANNEVPKDLKPYLDLAKGKRLPQWWVIGSGGEVLLSGDMPSKPADMLTMLKGIGQ